MKNKVDFNTFSITQGGYFYLEGGIITSFLVITENFKDKCYSTISKIEISGIIRLLKEEYKILDEWKNNKI